MTIMGASADPVTQETVYGDPDAQPAEAPAPEVAAQPAPVAAPMSKDFTFKRIGVSKHRTGAKRITVQIDPAEQARIIAMAPAVPALPENPIDPRAQVAQPETEDGDTGAGKKRAAAYDWFWTAFSPKLADSGPGRLSPAVDALNKGPGGAKVSAPRLSTLQSIADQHGAAILKATIGTNVSPALVLAVIGVESSGRSAAVSSAGATGLMQLMPATAERFGVSDRTNPEDNINGGVAYLDWLLKEFSRDPVMALAGYNAGENAVKKNAGVPPYAETRDYVPKVLAAWTVARNLCVTPPLLVSDGCVFRPSPKMQKPAAKPATNKEG